ncbi:hypothetical protein RDI58_007822 [Solanum bulbocastanum]|uniref:Uncharacterized protein n=1 Tax=Solanum bulbocastanum TaxID=147425 RepID=A0AAN8TVV8_SOLBU
MLDALDLGDKIINFPLNFSLYEFAAFQACENNHWSLSVIYSEVELVKDASIVDDYIFHKSMLVESKNTSILVSCGKFKTIMRLMCYLAYFGGHRHVEECFVAKQIQLAKLGIANGAAMRTSILIRFRAFLVIILDRTINVSPFSVKHLWRSCILNHDLIRSHFCMDVVLHRSLTTDIVIYKTTVPIALCCNDSYDDMIASVIEAGELTCEPNDLVISYQMNERGKIHPTFIKSDRHASLYMLDIGIDGSRPTLRINVNVMPPIEPMNSFKGDNDSIGNERLGDHS